jgi:hypothetical protein
MSVTNAYEGEINELQAFKSVMVQKSVYCALSGYCQNYRAKKCPAAMNVFVVICMSRE